MSADPYSSFKLAFEEQRSKIEKLHERISKLEEENSKVIAFVKQNGSLPIMNEDIAVFQSNRPTPLAGSRSEELIIMRQSSNTRALENDHIILSEDLSQPNTEELISDTSNTSSQHPTSYTSAQTPTTEVLSDIVQQQTVGLGEALKNLGLKDSLRDQVLSEIRANVSTILSTRLGPENLEKVKCSPHQFTASPASSAVGVVYPAYASMHSSVTASSRGDGSSSSLPIPTNISHSAPEQVSQTPLLDVVDASTPVNAFTAPLSPTGLQEQRRRELSRLNKRMTCDSGSLVNNAIAFRVQSAEHGSLSIHEPKISKLTGCAVPIPLPRTFGLTMTSPASGRDDSAGCNQGYLQQKPLPVYPSPAAAVTQPKSSASTAGFVCPCGDRYKCPLTLVKQHQFATDVRVRRGFTLVGALFRGRFVRQLLATHKVYDLIRTVKDTAKLALAIHVERQASGSESGNSAGTTHSAQPNDEELVLENRLMTQLRSSLSQLHDIFFRWPVYSQIELLHLSRSLPQRPKRAPNKSLSARDTSQQADTPASEPNCTTRRRWQHAVPQRSSDQFNQQNRNETRVLRLLQPDEVDRLSAQVLAEQPDVREKEKYLVTNRMSDRVGLRRQSQWPSESAAHAEIVTRVSTRPTHRGGTGVGQYRRTDAYRLPFSPSVHAASPRTAGFAARLDKKAKENANPNCAPSTTRSHLAISCTPVCSESARATPNRRNAPVVYQHAGSARSSRNPGSRATCMSALSSRLGTAPSLRTRPDSKSSVQSLSSKVSGRVSGKTVRCDSGNHMFEQPPLAASSDRPADVVAQPDLLQTESDMPVHTIPDQRTIVRSRSETIKSAAKAHNLCRLSSRNTESSNRPPIYVPQSVRARRPVSGSLGQAIQASADNSDVFDHRYPIRKRIVASRKSVVNSSRPPDKEPFVLVNQYPHERSHTTVRHAGHNVTTEKSKRNEQESHTPFQSVDHQLRATWSLEALDGEN